MEETANMLRGMCMDPRIPHDTKEALWSRVRKLDAATEAEQEDSKADDLYARLHSLSKALEGSGRIDEHDYPDAYATVLDAMNFVRGIGA